MNKKEILELLLDVLIDAERWILDSEEISLVIEVIEKRLEQKED